MEDLRRVDEAQGTHSRIAGLLCVSERVILGEPACSHRLLYSVDFGPRRSTDLHHSSSLVVVRLQTCSQAVYDLNVHNNATALCSL